MSPMSEIGLTIIKHDCGWVIEYAKGEEVAQAIRKAMANPEALAQKGRNGRKAFLEHFTLASAAMQYRKALERL